MQTEHSSLSNLIQDDIKLCCYGYLRETYPANKSKVPYELKKIILLFLPLSKDALITQSNNDDGNQKEKVNEISITDKEIKEAQSSVSEASPSCREIVGANLIEVNLKGAHSWIIGIKGKSPIASIGIINQHQDTYYVVKTDTGEYITNNDQDCVKACDNFFSLHRITWSEEYTLKITLDTTQGDNIKLGFKIIGDRYILQERPITAFQDIKVNNYRLYINISTLLVSTYTLIRYKNIYETEISNKVNKEMH